MAENRIEELTGEVSRVLKDAVYIGVGFGVLAFQRLQVQRQDLKKGLDRRLESGKEQVEHLQDNVEQQLKTLDERLAELERRIDNLLDRVQDRLPDQAADLLVQARDTARKARDSWHDLLNPEAKEPARAD